ncbi:CLUMA_CG002519, isoform A [Clunio marinus]|uniref:CLUMA_CG002519, isoform A n=1 Tax=Clunio marinus TaxID=568069 RepID=A0A1J1HLT5_9DIPT|nr:CLUMA_CG002519, isoform A [Clunio marinus]
MMANENRRQFFSLSQEEILGFNDEHVDVNVTKLKKKIYYFIVSFGYILNGFYVGWSSKFFSLNEKSSDSNDFRRSQISWIISTFPLGVVIASFLVYKLYYYIGTKLSLLVASLLILLSWAVTICFGNKFEALIFARIIGGLGGGIVFILVPLYMKELMGPEYNSKIVELLITLFGLGIFTQYFIDLVTPLQHSWIVFALALLFFVICCLIPESPRYQAFREMEVENTYDFEKAVRLHKLFNVEDLQRKSLKDLFNELKKLNLLSVIGLFLVEQFIGGISILFYMKHFSQLTGGHLSPEMMATTVGVTLIFSIPLSKLVKFSRITSIRKQIISSSMVILSCMAILAVFCVTEGSVGYKLNMNGVDLVPVAAFVIVTFFYVVGISRNLLLIMQQILSSYALQLHLRTLSIAVTWFFIFAMTKLLPQLLYLVGVGYFYCYMVVFALIALIFLCKIIPSSLNLEVDRATPSVMETSLVMASSVASETPSANPLSTTSSFNEVHQAEEI